FLARGRRPLLDLRGFGFGEKFLVAKCRRPLELSERGVGPHALQIGLTVGGLRRRPGLRRVYRLRSEGAARQRGRDHQGESDVSAHSSLPEYGRPMIRRKISIGST